MSQGRQAVGHPVDVGSGAVFTKRHDFMLPGTIQLDWVRRYATDCGDDSWLGPGWSLPYFMRLEWQQEGLLLIDESGRPLLFPLTQGDLQVGERVTSLGANMELWRLPTHYEILHWHHGSNDVERFAFLPAAGSMPLAWIENLAGHRLAWQYDSAGRPRRLTQELEQRVLELSYDVRNLLVAVHFIGDDGQPELLAHYEYDSERRLVLSINALGHACSYAYDSQHRLIQEGNPLGSSFYFRYDTAGRCVHTWGDGGYLERRLQYFSAPPMTRVTDSLGHVTQYILNPAGQVVQEVSPLGAAKTTKFDAYGRTVSITHPDGKTQLYEYDGRGNRTALIDEGGGAFRITCNDLHLITAFTDPLGASWIYRHDTQGNLLSMTNPLGAKLECVRDLRGLVIESRRPGGLVTQRRYGPRLRSMEISDQLSSVLKVEIDARGNQTAMHDAKGLRQRIKSDRLGRPIEVADALGRVTWLSYNGNNDLVERVLPGKVWERWHYDAFGRLVAHENAAGTQALEYDTEDHLVAVVNRSGERLTRSYDADGRLVKQTFFDGRIEQYDYNPRGLLTLVQKSDGRSIKYKYDPVGHLIERSSSDGLHETFVYNPSGKLVAANNVNAEVELIRDSLGRVMAEVQNGRRVDYCLDIENYRTTRSIVGIDSSVVAMRYDVRGRLIRLADAAGVCQELVWDAADQLVERRVAGGAVETYGYDDGRRLVMHRYSTPSGARLVEQRFEYDEADNIVVREDLRRGRSEFRYDVLSRLTQVRRNGHDAEAYLYDANGTLLQTHRGPRDTRPGGRNLGDGVRRYQYGDDGCVHSMDGGAKQRQYLRHDVFGRLVGATLLGGGQVRYAYDALGRRVLKDVDGQCTRFVWHSCDLAAEFKDGASPVQYFHYNQTPLAQWQGKHRQTPVLDPIGLPLAVADASGQPLWEARYEAYGVLASESGGATCPMRFRGQYHDRETGFHYNFNRYYDPLLAGYTAPDPIGLAGGAQFYAYPRNPLLWDDPFGLTCNKHKGQMGEAEMDAHYAAAGYTKLGSHDAPQGGGAGRPQGIDGVYHNPNGTPAYIIAEAKYGSAGLGQTTHSGQQMSDHWIDTPIGGHGSDRLSAAVPNDAAAIRNSALTSQGSVVKETFRLPDPGTPGTGSPERRAAYTPGSGGTTF